MTRLPFTENRLSIETCEIILLDRKFPPNMKHLAITVLVVAGFAAIARLQQTGDVVATAWVGVAVLLFGLLVSHPIYYWFSRQLWVPTTLLANIDWLKGYAQTPSPLLNFLTETPLQLNWSQVRQVTICHRPWVYATDTAELDLILRDATHITLRLPRMVGEEKQQLAELFRTIGSRRGFDVVVEPATQEPKIWLRSSGGA
ncbi:MAG: hypothetical protein JWP26_4342 [Devosia sp.]|nr:hypothetical protein [Devosia sp.]